MMSKISKKTKTRGASSEQIKPVSFHFKFEHSARIMFLFFWFKHVQPTIHNHTRCFARIVLYSGHLTVLFSFKKIRIFHRLLLSLTFWLAIFHHIPLLALFHLIKKLQMNHTLFSENFKKIFIQDHVNNIQRGNFHKANSGRLLSVTRSKKLILNIYISSIHDNQIFNIFF